MVFGESYEVRELEGRGRGVVALRDFKVNEIVLEESCLISVKTYMILSGVIVYRREKVETKYGLLSEAESQLYHSLHPIGGGTATDAATAGNVLRHRSAAAPDAPAQLPTLSSQDHLKIWESCGFHFCDPTDVQRNQVLHLMVGPALLSAMTGAAYAYRFQGQYMKSILAAGVFFFAIMGPICARVFYFGSQGLFVTASRLNHSCLPNCEVHIEAKVPGKRPQLSLSTKQAVRKGQELTIDYIADLQHLDATERRKLLEQDYAFSCTCPRCRENTNTAANANPSQEEEEET